MWQFLTICACRDGSPAIYSQREDRSWYSEQSAEIIYSEVALFTTSLQNWADSVCDILVVGGSWGGETGLLIPTSPPAVCVITHVLPQRLSLILVVELRGKLMCAWRESRWKQTWVGNQACATVNSSSKWISSHEWHCWARPSYTLS